MLSQAGLDHTEVKIHPMISAEVSETSMDAITKSYTHIVAGIWGATIGTQRMLKLFDKHNIKTTWFIPSHTLESFPEDMAAVRDAGHEIGLHGYTHENPAEMTIEQQRDVLDKTFRLLADFAGKPPRGSVAPW